MKENRIYDLIGVGLGPFNLSLAALAEPLDLDVLFLEKNARFNWHPGLLLNDATLQVPFMADLVTLIDPTNRMSFLQYLHESQRLYKFYFREDFHISRLEYNHYCQWVCEQLKTLRFNQNVCSVTYDGKVWHVTTQDNNTYLARHISVGIGSKPYFPKNLENLNHPLLQHAANFSHFRNDLLGIKSVCVVGSGQSAAEIILELLNDYDRCPRELFWVTRSRGFFPMEYSKLGLEHFSPEYMQYFYKLDQETRENLVAKQDHMYKGISFKTIGDIFDKLYQLTIGNNLQPLKLIAHSTLNNIVLKDSAKLVLDFSQWQLKKSYKITSEAVILATGYKPREPYFLSPLKDELIMNEKKKYFCLNEDFSIQSRSIVNNKIFIQNDSLYTHGIGSPDLGLICYRNGIILNKILGKKHYSIHSRNVFQQFCAQ